MSSKRRRGGSLVLPIVLITLGFLFLLDNLGALPDGAWGTVWRLWPVLIIAIGLEILFGRRVSFGAIFVLVVIVVVLGAVVWGSVIFSERDLVERSVRWPREGTESAVIEIDVGIGELDLATQADMAELLYANLKIPEDADVQEDFYISQSGRARGELRLDWHLPALFAAGKWEIDLYPNLRLEELRVNTGIGDADLALSELRLESLDLSVGIGSARVTLPEPDRQTLDAYVHTGIGDAQVTVPPGVQARIRVNRGLGDLTVYSRFERHGDYYQTEEFDTAERYIDLEVDVGIGSITLR